MKINVRDKYLAVYASYASAFYSNMIFPRTISRRVVDEITAKFLLGFSNVPGPIKPLYYENESKTSKYYCNTSKSFFNCSGKIGLSICIFSFSESFSIGITSDDNVMDKETNAKFCRYIYESLNNEMLRLKDTPIPEKKKDK